MKKLLSALLLALLLVPVTSCDSDSPKLDDDNDYPIFDLTPVELCISIVDEQGNSLLDESYDKNIVGAPITFSDEKEVYSVDWETYKKVAGTVCQFFLALCTGQS